MRILTICGVLAFAMAGLAAPEASDNPIKKDVKAAGKEIGHAARKVGQGFKRGGKAVGHGVRDGAKAVGHGVKHAVKKD